MSDTILFHIWFAAAVVSRDPICIAIAAWFLALFFYQVIRRYLATRTLKGSPPDRSIKGPFA